MKGSTAMSVLRRTRGRIASPAIAIATASSFATAEAVLGCGTSSSGAPGDGGTPNDISDAAGIDASSGSGAQGGIDAGQGGDSGGAGGMCPITEVFSPPCNALVPSGAVVTPTCSSATAPQPQGYTVADGIYFLESSVWYGPGCQEPPTALARSTWLMCGTLWYNAVDVVGSDAGTVYTNYSTGVNGTTIFLNSICNAEGTQPGQSEGFTASGSQLMLFTTYNGFVIVNTYALQ